MRRPPASTGPTLRVEAYYSFGIGRPYLFSYSGTALKLFPDSEEKEHKAMLAAKLFLSLGYRNLL